MPKRSQPPKSVPDSSLVDLYERPTALGIVMRIELVMMTVDTGKMEFLMFKREQEPFEFCFSLPNRYLDAYYTVEQTAAVIGKRLKVSCGRPHLTGFYSHPDRHPQHRAISVGYVCAASRSDMVQLTQRDPRFELVSFDPQAVKDYMAEHAPFAPDPSIPWKVSTNMMADGVPVTPIAFDHELIIRDAVFHLEDTLDCSMLLFDFLPSKFTLYELQRAYETFLRRPVEKVLFRKRMIARTFVNRTKLRRCGEQRKTAGRPAELYELYREPMRPKIEQED